MIGFGIVAGGWDIVNWSKVGSVVASWVISPVVGGLISYFIFRTIFKVILDRSDPLKAAKNYGPVFIGATFFIITSSLFLKTPVGKDIGWSLGEFLLLALLVGFITSLLGRFLVIQFFVKRKIDNNHSKQEIFDNVEEIFRRLQIMTSCYVAFALGANDVANAIGPMAAAFSIEQSHIVSSEVEVPYLLLFLGGIGIATGMATWGYRVIKTIGTKITKLNNTRGFSIDFGAATSVLLASKLGMPVSTTHAVVGAVIGVGLARGLEAVDLRVIKQIVVTWVITVPIAAVTAGAIFWILKTTL
jgi:PiT family inorganic phosphate transporter